MQKYNRTISVNSRYSSVSTVTSLRVGQPRKRASIPRMGDFSSKRPPALKPTQPPYQWVLEAFSRRLKRSGSENNNSIHLLPGLRMRGSTHPLFQTHSWHAQAQLNVYHLQLLACMSAFLFSASICAIWLVCHALLDFTTRMSVIM
jgi:hypothetical protein